MKNILFVIALLCVPLGPGFAQTPATPSPTAQAELTKLNTEIVKLYTANRLNEALPLAEKVRAQTAALFGADHAEMITAWKNLAEIQFALKKYGAAVASFEAACKLQEAKLGAKAVPLAATLVRLGVAYIQDGQTDNAEKPLTRALAIREEKLPANHLLTAEPTDLLGQIYDFKRD